ncbi:hypothetical protein N9535_02430 [Amylibacter sp.]|nr:hypothetical protein [Amylibacter sp.]
MVTFLNSPRHLSIYDGVDIDNGHSHRERDDSYSKVIIQPAPRWRIIECRNALQWIIQHRSSKPLNRGYWLGVSYLTSRNKLIEVSTGLNLLSDALMSDKLSKLPNHINQSLKKIEIDGD